MKRVQRERVEQGAEDEEEAPSESHGRTDDYASYFSF